MRWGFVLLIAASAASSALGRRISESQRDGKFFNLFNIVKFDNGPCETESGAASPNGTCYSNWECDDRGGESSGNCASGFGRCCVIAKSDDKSSVDEPISYFQNPDYPQSSEARTDSRQFTIQVSDEDICQVRIDFDDFDLAPQTGLGECDDQYLTIEGIDHQFCGDNAGQHVYLPIDSVPASLDLEVTIASDENDYDYKHSLRITQIDCNTNNDYMKEIRAPDGCTQYFYDTSGEITSFNYDGVNMYQKNQDYAICVKKDANMCGIKYSNPTAVSGKDRSIGLAIQTACGGADASGTAVAGTTDSGCGDDCLGDSSKAGQEGDWISIAQGQLEDYLDYSNPASYKAYYCGQGLGADVIDGAKGTVNGEVEGDGVRDFSGGPFVMYFHTDDVATNYTAASGKIQNDLGFVIKYSVQTGRCK
jgi:hypothetical protein